MTQTTTPALTLKDLNAQAKAQREAAKALTAQIKGMKNDRKEADKKEAEDLMADLAALSGITVIAGENNEHIMTLEQALVSGLPVKISVKAKEGESTERDHKVFMDAARVTSLRKAVQRIHKIFSNEEIRPKKTEVAETVA